MFSGYLKAEHNMGPLAVTFKVCLCSIGSCHVLWVTFYLHEIICMTNLPTTLFMFWVTKWHLVFTLVQTKKIHFTTKEEAQKHPNRKSVSGSH